jgi:hypothetical protein
MQHDYMELVGNLWTSNARATFDDLCNSILRNPCLRRFNQKRLMVLQTDFLLKGFCYVVCQADDNDVSLALAS